MANVFVDAGAEIGRDVANNAPEERQAVGVDIVERVVGGVEIFEDNQPDVNREERCAHAPGDESSDDSASSYHHVRSGIVEQRVLPIIVCRCAARN